MKEVNLLNFTHCHFHNPDYIQESITKTAENLGLPDICFRWQHAKLSSNACLFKVVTVPEFYCQSSKQTTHFLFPHVLFDFVCFLSSLVCWWCDCFGQKQGKETSLTNKGYNVLGNFGFLDVGVLIFFLLTRIYVIYIRSVTLIYVKHRKFI